MSYEHHDTNCGEGMYRDTPKMQTIAQWARDLDLHPDKLRRMLLKANNPEEVLS